jgi:alpha-D-xyloside xylohydrolase
MVNPVTDKGATSRTVYLPGKETWYDFWTGKREQGSRTIRAAAPIEIMPLYIPAGAILPMGPVVQFTGEKSADSIELRVYRGANGSFKLYEDEGDNYSYEKGAYTTIQITWNESAGTLNFGARIGTFPGMLKNRTFHVVFVAEGHGTGVAETVNADQTVKYDGKPVVVKSSLRRGRSGK